MISSTGDPRSAGQKHRTGRQLGAENHDFVTGYPKFSLGCKIVSIILVAECYACACGISRTLYWLKRVRDLNTQIHPNTLERYFTVV